MDDASGGLLSFQEPPLHRAGSPCGSKEGRIRVSAVCPVFLSIYLSVYFSIYYSSIIYYLSLHPSITSFYRTYSF